LNTYLKKIYKLKPKRSSVPSLLILIYMVSVGPFGDTEYTPSLPHIAHYFNVEYGDAQYSMSSYLFGFAIGQLVYGPLSDRIGRRPAILYASCIFILGSLICAVSFNIGMLIFGRFIQALGACAGSIVSNAAVRDVFDEKVRNRVYIIINGSFAAAPALGPIAGAIIDNYLGWRYNFYLLLILGGVLFCSVWLFFGETCKPKHMKAHKKAPLTNIIVKYLALAFKHPVFILNGLMQGVSIGIVYTSLVEAPDLIMNVLGLPSLYFIFVALLLLGAFVAGSIFCIILDKFLTRTIIMFIAFLIMIGGSILMYFLYHFVHLNLFLAMLPIMVTFFGISNVIPISTSQALSPYGHIAGIASAELGFFQMILASLTTFIVALLHDPVLNVLPYVFFILSVLGLFFVCIDYICIKFNKW
jgi:MFS transporter, DHA1 family, multidrug resistance protein